MYIKKSLKLLIERSIFHLKSLKIIFWIPLVVLNVFLPIMNYLQYKNSGLGELLHLSIIQYAQMFIPFCSVWWVIFIARQYVETDGNELYFVTQSKSKIGDYLIPFVAFLVNVVVLYSVYISLIDGFAIEFLKIIIVCISFFFLACFVIFAFNSITVTLLFLLLYLIANIVLYSGRTVFPFYYAIQVTTMREIVCNGLPLLLLSLTLFVIGIIINKHRKKFN